MKKFEDLLEFRCRDDGLFVQEICNLNLSSTVKVHKEYYSNPSVLDGIKKELIFSIRDKLFIDQTEELRDLLLKFEQAIFSYNFSESLELRSKILQIYQNQLIA